MPTALPRTSRSYQRALCPEQECPPGDHGLCWPPRDGTHPHPCGVPGQCPPNTLFPSPVPSSLRSTGKCLLYCNGVLEPLYLCPNGARCATWFQDPTRFTGTVVRSGWAPALNLGALEGFTSVGWETQGGVGGEKQVAVAGAAWEGLSGGGGTSLRFEG